MFKYHFQLLGGVILQSPNSSIVLATNNIGSLRRWAMPPTTSARSQLAEVGLHGRPWRGWRQQDRQCPEWGGEPHLWSNVQSS